LWSRATKPGAITSFLVGVLGYGGSYLYLKFVKEINPNPFEVAGYSIIAASVVMVVVSLLTKPMPQEHLDRVFKS